ncbi:MAG: acylphosphatase [Gammaproteobacteria bacterium]|nr:acylphosphatase [Gammaproteobacteria bacterium]
MSLCEKCIVHGRVQGVFYRASTQQEAQRHGVNGYARNLADGSVEVLLCGDPDAVGHMKAWLWQGPPSAHVSEVVCHLCDDEAPTGFVTK